MNAAGRLAAERFWSKVDRSGGPAACWPWLGSIDPDGYGRFQVGRRHRRAHRLVLAAKIGRPLQPHERSLHTCDNPPCCNPAHLFVGTQADNVADMIAKGRQHYVVGTRNGQARLDALAVAEARKLASEGMPSALIAGRLGVSYSTINAAVHGKTWRHVPGAIPIRRPDRAARDRQIRELAGQGASERRLASMFGLSRPRIWQIKRGVA